MKRNQINRNDSDDDGIDNKNDDDDDDLIVTTSAVADVYNLLGALQTDLDMYTHKASTSVRILFRGLSHVMECEGTTELLILTELELHFFWVYYLTETMSQWREGHHCSRRKL